MTRSAALLVSASFLLAAHAASAQQAPPLAPDRDATVTYRVTETGPGAPSGQPADVRMYFKGGSNLVRIDGPPGQGYAIVDRTDHHATVVMPAQHSYFVTPPGQGEGLGFLLDSSMRFTRQGSGSVLGHPCTEWGITTPDSTGSACVGADGVLLKADGRAKSGQGSGSAIAVSINYAPLAASVFAPPSGYKQVSPPAGNGQPQGQHP